jgi:hypothetical protein
MSGAEHVKKLLSSVTPVKTGVQEVAKTFEIPGFPLSRE